MKEENFQLLKMNQFRLQKNRFTESIALSMINKIHKWKCLVVEQQSITQYNTFMHQHFYHDTLQPTINSVRNYKLT